ncbi:MAG: hypothetical protein WD250_04925 [Egibacteraceae bacterium]
MLGPIDETLASVDEDCSPPGGPERSAGAAGGTTAVEDRSAVTRPW